MDNTLKLILGVLGISGLLAMLVPAGDIMAPAAPPVAQEVAPPVEPGPEPAVESTDESDDGDGDIDMSQFGQPTLDGAPIGVEGVETEGSASSEQESPANDQPAQVNDTAQQASPYDGVQATPPAPVANPEPRSSTPHAQTPDAPAKPARPANWL